MLPPGLCPGHGRVCGRHPTVIGEAMTPGLSVISTRLSGIPKIVPEDADLLLAPALPMTSPEP